LKNNGLNSSSHREIILGIVDAFKGFFSFIPGFSKSKTKPAPSRQPVKLPSTRQRSTLKEMSQAVNPNEQGNIPLPVDVKEFEIVSKYVDKIKQKFSGFKAIPADIRAIAQKMVSVSEEVANQMGVPQEKLIELGKKFQQNIGPVALFQFQDSLTKVLNFYEKSFNMSGPMALA
jgi:hypothetical protein